MDKSEPFSDDPIHFPGSAAAFASARMSAGAKSPPCSHPNHNHYNNDEVQINECERGSGYAAGAGLGVHNIGDNSSKRIKLTFADVWHAAKTERHFDYMHWINVVVEIIISYLMQRIGYIMVVVVALLVLFLGASGLLYVTPLVSPRGTTMFYVNIALGVVFLTNILLNYYLAVTTDPGGRGDADFAELCGEYPTGVTHCDKCPGPRPPRAHHCSVCDRCVLKMDHHCPFINNCVGQKNYVFFCRFLIWTTLCTGYLSAVILPELSSSFYDRPVLDDGYGLADAKMPQRGNLRNGYRRLERLQNGMVRAHAEDVDNGMERLPPLDGDNDRLSIRQYVRSADRAPPAPTQFSGKLMKDHEAGVWAYIQAVFMSQSSKGGFSSHKSGGIYVPSRHKSVDTYEEVANQGIVKSFVDSLIRQNDLLMVITFLFSLSVFFTVGALCLMHIYLVVSGQTSIEMSRNQMTIAKMNEQGRVFIHQYDRGWKRNMEQVFGTSNFLLAILPSLKVPNSIKRL